MASKRISIQLTGRFDDQKNVRFDEFRRQLDAISETLRELDYRFMGKKKTSVYYRIVELYTASPPTLVLEHVASDPEIDYGDAVAERFKTHLKCFAKKEIPSDVDPDLREKYFAMIENINGNITRMRVTVDGEAVTITGKIAAYLRPEEVEDKEAINTLSGKLETLQLHGTREFRIWPILGARSVLCVFPESLREDVKKYVDQWVAVTGTVRYKAGSQFPSEMIVKNIRPKREPDSKSSLLGMRGIGDKLPTGVTSEEIIRRMREDEW